MKVQFRFELLKKVWVDFWVSDFVSNGFDSFNYWKDKVTCQNFSQFSIPKNAGNLLRVAGVAMATPIFQILLLKIVPKISQNIFYLL